MKKWNNPDKVVMAGDLLRIESWLLPGCCILVDGRNSNVRFIQKHFYRNWEFQFNYKTDVSVFELQEPPLGLVNEQTLNYCLGNNYKKWK